MKEKKVIISEHAKESIRLRGTSEEEVKLTIFESDWEPAIDGRLKAEKNFPLIMFGMINGIRWKE